MQPQLQLMIDEDAIIRERIDQVRSVVVIGKEFAEEADAFEKAAVAGSDLAQALCLHLHAAHVASVVLATALMRSATGMLEAPLFVMKDQP